MLFKPYMPQVESSGRKTRKPRDKNLKSRVLARNRKRPKKGEGFLFGLHDIKLQVRAAGICQREMWPGAVHLKFSLPRALAPWNPGPGSSHQAARTMPDMALEFRRTSYQPPGYGTPAHTQIMIIISCQPQQNTSRSSAWLQMLKRMMARRSDRSWWCRFTRTGCFTEDRNSGLMALL